MCHLHTNNKLSKSQRLLDSIAVAYFTTKGSVAESYFRQAFRKFSLRSNITQFIGKTR